MGAVRRRPQPVPGWPGQALDGRNADPPDLGDPRHARRRPKLLEYKWGDNDIRWELEPLGDGTRLTLWHAIDRGFISMGAAGWHICLDVLDRSLAAEPIGRIVGGEAMTFDWPRLNAEYAKQFGIDASGSPPNAPRA